MLDRLSKRHFLILGILLIAASAFLWYWDWRWLGIPAPLRAEHMITTMIYLVGLIILAIFITRLTKCQSRNTMLILLGANIITILTAWWINKTYPQFFDLIRNQPLESYDPNYISNWQNYFLNPLLFFLNTGIFVLFGLALAMFIYRKKDDQPC